MSTRPPDAAKAPRRRSSETSLRWLRRVRRVAPLLALPGPGGAIARRAGLSRRSLRWLLTVGYDAFLAAAGRGDPEPADDESEAAMLAILHSAKTPPPADVIAFMRRSIREGPSARQAEPSWPMPKREPLPPARAPEVLAVLRRTERPPRTYRLRPETRWSCLVLGAVTLLVGLATLLGLVQSLVSHTLTPVGAIVFVLVVLICTGGSMVSIQYARKAMLVLSPDAVEYEDVLGRVRTTWANVSAIEYDHGSREYRYFLMLTQPAVRHSRWLSVTPEEYRTIDRIPLTPFDAGDASSSLRQEIEIHAPHLLRGGRQPIGGLGDYRA